MDIQLQQILGRWDYGVALDLQTRTSIHTGWDNGKATFRNERSPIGELMFRLKQRSDLSVAPEIVEVAVHYLQALERVLGFAMLVPVPPSNLFRPFQPVMVLAEGIGRGLGIPVVACLETTRACDPLKNIRAKGKRLAMIDGLYRVDSTLTEGQKILLFDDIYRSSTTLNAVADVLLDHGHARNLYALTITKTRVHR